MTTISFTRANAPVVSAVMVTYGHWDWASRSLRAFAEATDDPYEVIVVDNASPDDTPQRLASELENAQVLLNPANYGFGAACNQGAACARGKFLVFLNSDTLVHDGWLLPLLDCLSDPGVGAVAPRILNRDGSLQEAGSLVSPRFGAAPYGEGQPASRPEYRFRRVVDYASAACLVVRRSAFNEVGGFDPMYGRGYFEDVDLCLALADRGYSVVYEPRSTVTHVKWVSFGEDQARELVDRNRALFSRRWRHRLGLRPDSIGHEGPRHCIAVRDAVASDRILFVARRVPRPPDQLRAVLELVTARWSTAAVALLADERDADSADALLALGVEVVERDDHEAWLRERRFHYDTVLLAADVPERLARVVHETQPQAYRIATTHGDAPRAGSRVDAVLPAAASRDELARALVGVLAEAGTAPPGARRSWSWCS